MDTAKVIMLAASSGARHESLSPKLRALADSEEFWQELEATDEDKLTDEQNEMLAALGVG